MLDKIIAELEKILDECESHTHANDRIKDLIVKVHRDKYVLQMAIAEARQMLGRVQA